MNRIKQRSVGTYTLTATAENEDGVAQTVTSPVSIVIRDGAGTVAVTDTPTIVSGKMQYVLDAADVPKLDTYTATWTGVVGGESQSWTTTFELVGDYLFEISDLRSEDRAFTDAVKYPAARLKQIRVWVEDVIEGDKAAAVAFVPRGRRVVLDGNGNPGLWCPDVEISEVYSVKIDGVTLTQSELDEIVVDDCILWMGATRHVWAAGHQNIEVHYVHGKPRCPGPVTRAALMLAREYLVKSDLPGRATASSIGDQWFRLTVAGRDGVTGLPEVDAAIDQHGRKRFRAF